MRNKRFYIIFLILIIFAVGLFSEELSKKSPFKVSGTVVDAKGRAIEGVSVVIPELNVSTKTNTQGIFSFATNTKPQMRVSVKIFKEGFMPYSRKLYLKEKRDKRSLAHKTGSDGEQKERLFNLGVIELSKFLLEEVVVTGTATPKLYSETSVKTFVANSDTLEKQSARNLADSLDLVTGVRVENNCQNCNFTQVRINGMEGKYTQVLMDGMPMFSALAGVYGLEQMPSNMIEKLEVVKGGGSSLYGGNAIAGVVNMVLKEPDYSGGTINFNQFLVDGDRSDSRLSLNYDYVSKDSKSKASLFGNYEKKEAVDVNGDDFSDIGGTENLAFGVNFAQTFDDLDAKLKLNFSAVSEDRRGGDMREINGKSMLDVPEHLSALAEATRTRRIDMGLGWEQMFGTKVMLKFSSAYSYTKRNSYYGAKENIDDKRAPDAYGLTTNPLFYNNVSLDIMGLKNHYIIVGASYKTDGLKDTNVHYDKATDETYKEFGFFLQDEISLFDNNLNLLLGVRADKHSELDDAIFSPRASIAYKGLKNFTLRTTISTGYRAPQVFDEDLHITQVGGEGMIIVNGDDLKEERSWSVTAGIDYGLAMKNKAISLSLGAFYNKVNDAFDIREIGMKQNALLYERYNTSGAKVYGVEFETAYKVAGLFEFSSGWTVQESRYIEPEGDFDSKNILRTPDVYGFFRLSLNMIRDLSFDFNLNYTGKMYVPHYAGYIPDDVLEKSKDFWVFDATINKTIRLNQRMIDVKLGVKNIFNEYQNDLDEGLYRDAGYVYGPRYPRTIYLTFKYSF